MRRSGTASNSASSYRYLVVLPALPLPPGYRCRLPARLIAASCIADLYYPPSIRQRRRLQTSFFVQLKIERGLCRLGRFGFDLMDLLRYHRAVERRSVRPVDLHHIARGVPQVHLHRPIRYLVEVGEVALLLPNVHLPRLHVRLLEVVNVYTEVVAFRGRGFALEEVQLQVAEAQPAHREWEVGGGNLLHPEKFLIETYRLIKVVSVDACVGKARSFYKPSFR